MVNVPATTDVLQDRELGGRMLRVPEIRVWSHPGHIGRSGSDYYHTFATFAEALKFINEHPEAERVPLVAFAGYELNLFMLLENTELKKRTDKPRAVRSAGQS